MSTNEKGTPQSRTYTVNDIVAILGIGRASACKLANSGLFKTIRIGNMIRIFRKSFEDWLKAEGLDDEMELVIWACCKIACPKNNIQNTPLKGSKNSFF